ncbi:sialidase family protein [Marilutibacter aestuarii]|uniref:Exo-alpha-sialidase n=1 Tax=Marilutibacter aestuarii TaxID=1706195 RepID=A0A508A8X1_9GAMM|nr:sialidase family protein [Lysobacter aestuarii]TQD45897.1 exo-alpha-sialidase [Lysobacter aestuarii]
MHDTPARYGRGASALPWCLLLLAGLSACGTGSAPEADRAASAPAAPAAFERVETLTLPAGPVASQPDLVATPDGGWLLAWIEPGMGDASDGESRGHRLMFSRTRAGEGDWSVPRAIARGDDWFLNWADTPHVQALPDGSLWAHWLRSTGPGRMDYGIDLVRSGDGGDTWSAPTLVNLADSAGDHGFVSFWPQGRDGLGIAWLDSRQKAAAIAAGEAEASDDPHHGGGAPMMLRAAVFDAAGERSAEWPLDTSTCDCCTTAAAITSRGPVVVYRGRTAGEIRDTRLVRFENGAWTAPRDVHADGWMMPGCPVNGPVVAARGERVWVAWFTQADGPPELRIARSDDAGDSFGAPLTVARGEHVLGRATLALAGDALLVAWLEETDAQRLQLARYGLDLSAPPTRRELARLAIRGRASGLPRLAVQGDEARIVWTDTEGGKPVLRGVRLH